MTRKRYTEEQIIAVLKDVQAGSASRTCARTHGISDATFYNVADEIRGKSKT